MNGFSQYIGRLAPSPTGLLHLGHAATFLTAYERAKAANGCLLLRIDDLDPQRSKEHFITAAKDDLRWLGMTWNEEVRQSERIPMYLQAMQSLLAHGLAYPCSCSRKDLQAALQAPHEDTDDEPVYSGHCRPQTTGRSNNAGAPIFAARTQGAGSCEPQIFTPEPDTSYRFRVRDGEIISFNDEHCGPQRFTAGCNTSADFGDFLLWRKEGLPSYQLACVIDDAAMGITEVVRGRDLLKSAARQILLQRALGLPTPIYLHADLIRDGRGERLAKRHDALSLRSLREQGMTPEAVRARCRESVHLS